MIKRIKRQFIFQISLFILLTLSIFMIVFYRQALEALEFETISTYNIELNNQADEINHNIIIATENVKSLSSRTMMRKVLYSYILNEISLDEVRTYSQPKYIDGTEVYHNIEMAVRTDIYGEIIAVYKTETDDIDIPDIDEDKNILSITRWT